MRQTRSSTYAKLDYEGTPSSTRDHICVLDGVPSSHTWSNRTRRSSLGLALIALILVGACNQTPTGGNNPLPPPVGNPLPTPQPPGPPPVGGKCAVVFEVNHKVSIPSKWVNSSAACDYKVVGTVSLSSYLEIEPGTVVQFSKDATFYIESGGQLNAVGTANARIQFLPEIDVKGYWNGLFFMSGSRESRLEYLDIRDAGQTGSESWKNYAGISGGGGLITFKHNRVSGSYAHGANFGEDLRLKEFEDNIFEDNLGFGLILGYNQVAILDKASDYIGKNKPNKYPYVYADWDSEDFREDGIWKDLGVPYYMNIVIYIKGALTLEPGVKIVANDGTRIQIEGGGSLKAIGTADKPIVFTAERKIPGAWEGIELYQAASKNNILDHVIIEYAGSGRASVKADGAFQGSYLSVSNTTIQDGDGLAICTGNGADTPTELVLGAGNVFLRNQDNTVGNCG
jgi:hypothetical protein